MIDLSAMLDNVKKESVLEIANNFVEALNYEKDLIGQELSGGNTFLYNPKTATERESHLASVFSDVCYAEINTENEEIRVDVSVPAGIENTDNMYQAIEMMFNNAQRVVIG